MFGEGVVRADEGRFFDRHRRFLALADHDRAGAEFTAHGPLPDSDADRSAGEVGAEINFSPYQTPDFYLAPALELEYLAGSRREAEPRVEPISRSLSLSLGGFLTRDLLLDAEFAPGIYSDRWERSAWDDVHLRQTTALVYGVSDQLQLLTGVYSINLEDLWGITPFAGATFEITDWHLWVQLIVPLRAEVDLDLGRGVTPYFVLEGDEVRYNSAAFDSDNAVLARDRWAVGVQYRIAQTWVVKIEAGEYFNSTVRAAGRREYLGTSAEVGLELEYRLD